METHIVQSSNISEIGYDTETQTLQVKFTSGACYQYFDVPRNLFEQLLQAESKGSFLAAHIKGAFRYSRV